MKLVSLVPHSVDICDDDGNIVRSIPPSGEVLRVKTSTRVVGQVEFQDRNVQVVETSYGEAEDLPFPAVDTVYIVSGLVVSALKAHGVDRSDIIAPDTSPASAVRDENGMLVGVKRFTR